MRSSVVDNSFRAVFDEKFKELKGLATFSCC